ncbi:hypothetical protein HMPREF1546_03266 [Oscillibacter sp. KLE 1745]|nr:hypothetical protein HMPREF1546_03266 [Oscillibacter sp. KLE 1745]
MLYQPGLLWGAAISEIFTFIGRPSASKNTQQKTHNGPPVTSSCILQKTKNETRL